MSDRQMPSIFPECDELKQIYDRCFSDFFQKFIMPNYRHQHANNPCERLHEVYSDCVKERLAKTKIYDIDLDELRKEVIGTAEEKMSIYAKYVMQPANGFTADLIRAVPTFVALRLSWTHQSLKSEGMEKFLEEHLPKIRANNPAIRYYLHKSYQWLRHRKQRVTWKSDLQILSIVEEMMAHTGDFREGATFVSDLQLQANVVEFNVVCPEVKKSGIPKRWVMMLSNKWKADEEDMMQPKTKDHPHYIYKNYPT